MEGILVIMHCVAPHAGRAMRQIIGARAQVWRWMWRCGAVALWRCGGVGHSCRLSCGFRAGGDPQESVPAAIHAQRWRRAYGNAVESVNTGTVKSMGGNRNGDVTY